MSTTNPIILRNPFLCPNCGKENARWDTDRELVVCPDCSQEIILDDYALNAALAEENQAA